eukprot:TRINITY_DN28433_c0_g1_i1.p1 TRINITY_DN28433_c0_g1~~TRINITY_DN28433_c0_g1_i1.p1  ORF type:complete len:105 (+),score=34.76 TRINITY_DN28433_c0_g1_i1:12-326(+)
MIRRPPRSTQSRSSAASDVYKRQVHGFTASGNANIKKLSCLHKFHEECFAKVSKKKFDCPVCNNRVATVSPPKLDQFKKPGILRGTEKENNKIFGKQSKTYKIK